MHLSLATLTVLASLLVSCNARAVVEEPFVCKPCETEMECNQIPPDCRFGIVRNACNRLVCGKGPLERCGGYRNYMGNCGEGMMCKADGRCHGCYVQTMDCSSY